MFVFAEVPAYHLFWGSNSFSSYFIIDSLHDNPTYNPAIFPFQCIIFQVTLAMPYLLLAFDSNIRRILRIEKRKHLFLDGVRLRTVTHQAET